MSIQIDQKRCRGCRSCTEVCPGNLIWIDATGKAFIREPRDCWGCTSCLKACSFEAIQFYLGADIGGLGSLMHTVEEGDYRHWIIQPPESESTPIVITVNRKDSNQY